MDDLDRGLLVGAAGLAVAGFGNAARAGPLNPSAGPITSTGKTLKQIEPRTAINTLPGDAEAAAVISTPGSYYLTGDLTAPAGRMGLKITVPYVHVDLMGFSLIGTGTGISQSPVGLVLADNCRIRNGFIRGFASVTTAGAAHCALEDLAVDGIAGGFRGALRQSLVRGVRISGGGDVGLFADESTSVQSCIVGGTFTTGIEARAGTHVRACAVGWSSSAQTTPVGIRATSARVEECAIDLYGIGIEADSAEVTACTITNCGASAVQLNSAVIVRDCHIAVCVSGVVGPNATRCRIEGVTVVAASGTGIALGGAANAVLRNALLQCATPLNIGPGNQVGVVSSDPASAAHSANFVL